MSGADALSVAGLYRLMTWLSPGYPVGAFAYSSGLEWAVESETVTDEASLRSWLAAVLAHGSAWSDAVLFARAHDAACGEDDARLFCVAELAAAFAPSRERHLETTAQGDAFILATRAAWPCDAIERVARVWDGACAYPVAVAVASAGHGIPREPALASFLHALLANLVSAGVRLVPLGQTQGQRIIAALELDLARIARAALATPLEDIGGCALRADLASMHHETQYTRLFRS